MKIIIVTPTLGSSPWLDETVASVAAFGGRVRQVIIAPESVVSELTARFPGVQVLAEPGGGMYAAINAGLSCRTDWDWGGYLNDDDTLASGFSSVIDASMNRGCEVIYGHVSYVDCTGRPLGRMPAAAPSTVGAVLRSGRAAFTQQGAVFSRELWERLGGFDLRWRLAADCDFWCRAVLKAARFARVRETVAHFRLHSRQLSADRARMDREIAAVHVSHRSGLAEYSSMVGLLRFGLLSLRYAIERRRHAGVWTSRALYKRASGSA